MVIADETMCCKRRRASSPIWVFFLFLFLFVANFGHLETKNKNGRRGAANCPKEFIFSGKKGPQSPYFKEKPTKKKWNSPYLLEHW